MGDDVVSFKFSLRSRLKLRNVHPDLCFLMEEAIRVSPIDFGITEGARSYTRQKELFQARLSQTMNSRHIPKTPQLIRTEDVIQLSPDKPYSHAVDIVCYLGRKVTWAWPAYDEVAQTIKALSRELDIPITWGGDWTTLRDGPHYELSWGAYPVKPPQETP